MGNERLPSAAKAALVEGQRAGEIGQVRFPPAFRLHLTPTVA
jgi:hypothetical protein